MASLEDTTWPLPKFRFLVTGMPGNPMFHEMSGIDQIVQVDEYRAINSAMFSPIKMPGLQKFGNVILKKGIIAKDSPLWDWLSSNIKMNAFKRTTLTISLVDETGAPCMTWTLNNAFPVRYSGTDMKSDVNEVALETLEIAYETLIQQS